MAESQQQDGALLRVDNLHYAYATNYALRGVTFAVRQGSIHGFVGPNGAGKTTTLKILATLLRPHHGGVQVFGLDLVGDYKRVRQRLGFMPDHFSMYRQMTVFEYLDFFAAAYGLALKERDRVVGDVLALTDMDARRDDLIKALSRGMQQRVNLARVLVHDPELLLLDEPASGLDPRARIELMAILKELSRMGKTMFISSHILSELEDLCDSVTIIDRGQVRYSGSMRELARTARLPGEGEPRTYMLALEEPNETVEEAIRAIGGVLEVARADGDEAEAAAGGGGFAAEYRVVVDLERVDANTILSVAIAAEARIVAFSMGRLRLSQAFMELTEPGVA